MFCVLKKQFFFGYFSRENCPSVFFLCYVVAVCYLCYSTIIFMMSFGDTSLMRRVKYLLLIVTKT